MAKKKEAVEKIQVNRQFYDCIRSKKRHLIHVGGSRCLRHDTIVKTRNGDMPISEINEDTELITHFGYQKPSEIMVNKPDKPVFKIKLKTGEVIYCTQDHEFFTPDGGSANLNLLLSLWNGDMEEDT